jgi:hypothetical protein
MSVEAMADFIRVDARFPVDRRPLPRRRRAGRNADQPAILRRLLYRRLSDDAADRDGRDNVRQPVDSAGGN